MSSTPPASSTGQTHSPPRSRATPGPPSAGQAPPSQSARAAGGPPPLRDLPDPATVPADPPSLVPAEEILLSSLADLQRPLWKRAWRIGLLMLGLWAFLLLNFVIGTAPTGVLLILPLMMMERPGAASGIIASLGFNTTLLRASVPLVPLLGAAASIAMIPLAARAGARMNPQRALGEREFQDRFSQRLADVLLAPVGVVVALQLLVTLSPLPSPWRELGPGPLAALGLGLIAVLIVRSLLRRMLPADVLLGIPSPAQIAAWSRTEDDDDLRHAALARLRAQDRRHLPPSPARLRPSAGSIGRALAITARALLPWPAILIGALMWVVFGISDAAITFSRVSEFAVARTGYGWPFWVAGALVSIPLLLVMGLAPRFAAMMHREKRADVTDQRTYLYWSQRSAVNPWEKAMPATIGWICAAAIVLAVLVQLAILAILGEARPAVVVWSVLVITVISPVAGAAIAHQYRDELRTAFYGPAGAYMRRAVPWALVAAGERTRADRDRDPAVQAARRDRVSVGIDAAILPGDPPRHESPHLHESGLLGRGGAGLDLSGRTPGAPTAGGGPGGLKPGTLPDLGAAHGPVRQLPAARRTHDIPHDIDDLAEPELPTRRG